MKAAIRHIVAHTYKPWLEKYLSKTRTYRYDDIVLQIPPEVFHPGFFFTTRILLNYISRQPLRGKSFLELGCGSGLISIYAAKKKARVTAIDINTTATGFLEKNARNNSVELTILHSDLFQSIPQQQFDIIAINPPFYKKHPRTEKEYAWYCGENGEYFNALFKQLGDYIHAGSDVLMVLFEGCDIDMIITQATENRFNLHCIQTRKNILEKHFIYKIERTN